MRKEYDFTDSVRNPYAKHFRKQVTMRLGTDVIEYFKKEAAETGVPYQSLIDLYLREQGFLLHDIYKPKYHADRRIMWANALYVDSKKVTRPG